MTPERLAHYRTYQALPLNRAEVLTLLASRLSPDEYARVTRWIEQDTTKAP